MFGFYGEFTFQVNADVTTHYPFMLIYVRTGKYLADEATCFSLAIMMVSIKTFIKLIK